MGMAPQDMARLRGEITGLRGARRELLNNMVRDAGERRNAVAAMGKHFHDAHAEMARTMSKERRAFLTGIKADVYSMQADIHNDLGDIHDANVRRARQTRQECASFVSGLKTEVNGLRAGFVSAHSQMARKAKMERLAFIADQKNSVSSMRADFRHDHNEMAASGRNIRTRFLSGLKANLSDMRAGFHRELADCRRSFRMAVKKAGAERSAFVRGLKQVVFGMRQQFASEITASRLGWLGVTEPDSRSGMRIAQSKQVQWKREHQEAKPAPGEPVEFNSPVAVPKPVDLKAGREDTSFIEAAKPPGREDKRMPKKDKRHQ